MATWLPIITSYTKFQGIGDHLAITAVLTDRNSITGLIETLPHSIRSVSFCLDRWSERLIHLWGYYRSPGYEDAIEDYYKHVLYLHDNSV